MAKIKDGMLVTLILRPGRRQVGPNLYADFERTVTGTVRKFETVDKIYAKLPDGSRGEQIDSVTSEHWEIETGDPQHPAIGFDPATAKFK